VFLREECGDGDKYRGRKIIQDGGECGELDQDNSSSGIEERKRSKLRYIWEVAPRRFVNCLDIEVEKYEEPRKICNDLILFFEQMVGSI
jgi:hypothetical protein